LRRRFARLAAVALALAFGLAGLHELLGVIGSSGELRADARAAHLALETARTEAALSAERHADASARLAEREQHLAAAQDPVRFLEEELRASLRREAHLSEALAEARRDLITARRDAREARQARNEPMPEGVRLALVAIQELLRADGHGRLWFLRARALEDRALLDVEVLERGVAGVTATLWLASRATLTIDRGLGTLTIGFTDGVAFRDGAGQELPDGGGAIVLEGVFGPEWERRLPYLVRAEGSYPAEATAEPRRAPELDPVQRETWCARLDRLLQAASTDVDYRVLGLADLDGGWFQGVHVGGYRGRNFVRGIEAEAMAVEIDRPGGTVSLRFARGRLHLGRESTSLPDTGYRILLPGVTPAVAIETLHGMVLER